MHSLLWTLLCAHAYLCVVERAERERSSFDKWPSCGSKECNRQFKVHLLVQPIRPPALLRHHMLFESRAALLCQSLTWQRLWPYVHFQPRVPTSVFEVQYKPPCFIYFLFVRNTCVTKLLHDVTGFPALWPMGTSSPNTPQREHAVMDSQNHKANH